MRQRKATTHWRAWFWAACLIAATTSAAPDAEVTRLNEEARRQLRNDPPAAQRLAQQALVLAQRNDDAGGEVAARINLGSIERQRGRHDRATIEFERAAALAAERGDQAALASAHANLGITLDLGGLHAEALAAQGKALAIYERLGNFANASAVLANLGNTLDALGDPVRARDHYQRALDMKRANGIRKGVGSILNNLADLALESGTTEQAVKLLDEAIAAHELEGDRIGEGLALGNRGIAHARAGRFEAALSDIQRGEAIARELEHAVGLSAALRARAEVWLLRARSLEGEARDYALLNTEREARAAAVASSDSDDVERQLRAKRLLAEVLAARGDAESAIALIDEIDQERALIRTAQDEERVAVVRARYERDRADRDLAVLREREATQQSELAHSRLLLRSAMGLGIAAMVTIVLLYWISRERRIRAEALREQGEALQEALAHAEAQSRRAQSAARLNQRLLAMAGADMQGPLVDIRAHAERLLSMHHANPDLSRPMATIARQASELAQVVLRMRESAQAAAGDAGTSASCNLSDVLQGALGASEARAQQRQQRLRGRITPGLRVSGGVESWSHLCNELLEQALRHNPADSNIDVILLGDAGKVELTLTDRDAALCQRLLDSQVEQPRDGQFQRLGMRLLRERVDSLGGHLDSIAANAPETGHLLRLTLPLVD